MLHNLLLVILLSTVYFIIGTVVMANQWAIMHDEKYFPEPHKFKADRFLDKERKFVRPDQKIFLPFSTGAFTVVFIDTAT